MEKLKKYSPLIAGILAIVAAVMIFLPAVQQTSFYGTATDSGLNVTFGLNGWAFSFMNLVTYALAILGAVLCFMSVKKENDALNIIAAVILVVAAVFFFMTVNFSTVEIMGVKTSANSFGCSLGIGAILGGICSIIAAVGIVCPLVLKKLGK